MAPSDPIALKHRLLVATPMLGDPNFDGTVVLVLEHDAAEGAVGVILNRPTESDLVGPLSPWASVATPPRVVFEGGPVSPNAAICLARAFPGEQADGVETLFDGVGTLDLERDPDLLLPAVQLMRVFAGYAGWGEGQLEDEVRAGAWFVVDARVDDVFGDDPETLWRSVLGRQRGSLAMFANYPPNPALN